MIPTMLHSGKGSPRDINEISGCGAQRKGRVNRRSMDNLKNSE